MYIKVPAQRSRSCSATIRSSRSKLLSYIAGKNLYIYMFLILIVTIATICLALLLWFAQQHRRRPPATAHPCSSRQLKEAVQEAGSGEPSVLVLPRRHYDYMQIDLPISVTNDGATAELVL